METSGGKVVESEVIIRQGMVCELRALNIIQKRLDFVLGATGDSIGGFRGSVLRCSYVAFRIATA